MAEDRIIADTWPTAVYAVGDVHGCLRELLALERLIFADAEDTPGKKWIVMLGDYVDRGPDSASVVAHLLEPPPDAFRRFTLRGNHEQMMLDFLGAPDRNLYWLEQGGLETLASYGVDLVRDFGPPGRDEGFLARLGERIPATHRAFIADLPLLLALPGWLFVHAGIRPGIEIEQQSAEDLIWIRGPFLSWPGAPGVRIVHGHTPSRAPVFTPARIGIDTQCFLTGRLTCLRVTPDGTTRILATR
jgi:serine/threonine protein phosphatase 1